MRLTDAKDPGAAADAIALERGKPTPPRGPERAEMPLEEFDTDRPRDWTDEQHLTDTVTSFIVERTPLVHATGADAFAHSGIKRHHRLGPKDFADAVLRTREGGAIVIEVELDAHGSATSGVRQVLRYRTQARIREPRATGAVIAQSFTTTECERARQEDIECIEVQRDANGLLLVHRAGPLGPLTRALRDAALLATPGDNRRAKPELPPVGRSPAAHDFLRKIRAYLKRFKRP